MKFDRQAVGVSRDFICQILEGLGGGNVKKSAIAIRLFNLSLNCAVARMRGAV